ncbi:uncharacterized protein LOC123498655 isoform X2 [Portunus trituberculatus]|uniref:uncharacterized protein LOC123498655 isoform X2 n=1 Tax=Portunus trituberculatus TaxID=210409 RepID=UPI001E1D0E39|nr:uncharacterized protein LOC123498655 isoform X2 [Portunus trituberculatus]
MALSARALALFLVCVSAADVSASGESVNVTVTTTSVHVSWQKEGQWKGVNSFHVDLKMNGYSFCDKNVLCLFSTSCAFNSEAQCGKIAPCADVFVTVTGNNFTAQVDVMTAPPAVNDINTKGPENRKTVTWTNPTSSCLKDLIATVQYGGYYNYTLVQDTSQNSVTVPLCMNGLGTVKVRARGGSGESDAVTALLYRKSQGDAVKIQNCPPQGCTEVDINWEYKPVCPDVDHLYLTLGDVFNTTTDLSVTGVTIKELDLNTKYRTCLHAFDVDDTLLARHCTNCRSQPEVVDKLSVTNVTDTTAVIDWEPPICPTADEIEYNVSYSKSGNKRSYITTDSKFQWTELKPAQNHNLCVTVLHNGITSADPACVDAFTLPESLGRIVVRVYEESSLFITWEGGFFTPNLKYRVSWGDDLTHFDYTEYKSYTIDGYNETVGPNEVCVEGETKLPTGLRSIATCQESPFPNFIPDRPRPVRLPCHCPSPLLSPHLVEPVTPLLENTVGNH